MIRPPSETQLRSLSEAELAAWRRKRGAHVVESRGRFWQKGSHGFYQPVHWLARLRPEETRLPALMCWGYRAALCDEFAGHANCHMPFHLCRRVQDYDLPVLEPKKRNKVRASMKRVQTVEVLDAALLEQQGFEVYTSAIERIGHGQRFSRDEYRAFARREVCADLRVVLAGLVEGKLAGYITTSLVEGTAYIDSVYLATENLPSNVGTGLVYEFMQICRRSGKVREVVYGLGTPELESLTQFKVKMGFPVIKIPSRIWMLPGLGEYIRRHRPHGYYRLFGKPANRDDSPTKGPTGRPSSWGCLTPARLDADAGCDAE